MDTQQQRRAPIITIDGPSGVGKGTMAKALAKQLGWQLLDSGSIYRLAALASIQQQVAIDQEQQLAQLCTGLNIRFQAIEQTEQDPSLRIFLNDHDVTEALRVESTGQRASQIAVLPAVRAALLQRQRDFAQPPGLVADGRDMGTVVFPEADIKIFLTASAEIRAQRRFEQLQPLTTKIDFAGILQQIEERDERDRNRVVAPLTPAADAVLIDTSELGIAEVLAILLNLIHSKDLVIDRS